MNKFMARLSRRERLYVLIAAAALFAGGILYPLLRASQTYRQEKLEELEAARALRETYQTVICTADQIRSENDELKEAIGLTDGLLFDRVGNDVMMDAWVVKLLNQMAPDMGLEISRARSSVRDLPGQLKFSVRGNGRYPEILNFFYQLESHRPLIVIQQFNISAQSGRRGAGQRGQLFPQAAAAQRARTAQEAEPSEPRMRLQMEIHLNCRTAEDRK
jgi:hypothetical protein